MPLNKLIQSYDKGQIQELYNTIYLTMYLNCKCNDKGYVETESKNIAKKIWSIESDWKRATLLKLTLIHGCFFMVFKLYKWYQIAQRTTYHIMVFVYK